MKLANGAIDFNMLEKITVGGGTFNFAGKKVTEIIAGLIPYLFAAAGALLLLYLIYGGFSYITSAGDPKKTQVAKGIITNAIVGVLIVIFAYIIVQVIALVFNITDIQTIFK